VVDWWAARGGATAMLQARYPEARIVTVEAGAPAAPPPAPPWWSPARWRARGPDVLGEDTHALDGQAGLLWSNMALHWVADPQAWFARWHQLLAVDGFVMFSCLGPDTLKELRALYARLDLGPAMRELIDMHDLGDMLAHAGFADPVMDMERITLTWESPEALLGELRTIGRNTHPQRHAGLRTPRWQARLDEALAALAGADGHAVKPLPRARVAAQTQVSLDDMRAMVKQRRSPAR
jgi:malonyl-CoA O-methyltransferase